MILKFFKRFRISGYIFNINFVPVIFVFLLLFAATFGFFTYVIAAINEVFPETVLGAAARAIYLSILGMVTWSYAVLLVRSPGYPKGLLQTFELRLWGDVPDSFQSEDIVQQLSMLENQIEQQDSTSPDNQDEDRPLLEQAAFRNDQISNLRDLTVSIQGSLPAQISTVDITICLKCKKVKPPRTHHCRICNRCIMRMDHHCPWLNNCVGFKTLKPFMVFLFWSTGLASFVFICILIAVIRAIDINGDFGMNVPVLLFMGFFSLVLSLSLLVFFGLHIYLILTNTTTIESFKNHTSNRGVDSYTFNQYDLGYRENLCQILGPNIYSWLLPTDTTRGNGYCYPSKNNFE